MVLNKIFIYSNQFLTEMEFEFDGAKSSTNRAKNGIDAIEAQLLLDSDKERAKAARVPGQGPLDLI